MENKNNDADWLLLVSVNKLTQEKNELCEKINQLLASQNMVKDNNELRDKIECLQMYVYSLKGSQCALEDHFSRSHGAQAEENQTKVLIVSLARLNYRENSSPRHGGVGVYSRAINWCRMGSYNLRW